ncbi:MAG TPA: tetratricopeptide repeat protein [Vicinamibacterales bacterium]|nr:tetratricopeptide repeat protein [Vicinamibacterales bacterium]
MRVFLAAALALCLFPAVHAQSDPKTAILETLGFDQLNAGQTDQAISSLRQAVSADPGNAALHMGLGVAAYIQQRDADAERELERAIALNSSLDQAHEFLGLVLHHQGDLHGAIRAYADWLAGKPPSDGTARAADTLERWQHELELRDRMDQTLSEHFTVSFEGPAVAELAQSAVDSLERAYARIGSLLSTYPTSAVPVMLYTTEQFQDVTRSPSWAAGSYDGVIRVPMRGALDKPEELDRVLAHEYTHALVHVLAPRAIPAWINEGLASALESADTAWADTIVASAPASIPLATLTSSFGRLNGPAATVAYAESALTMKALLDDIGGAGVVNLIRDLGEGQSFDTAFAHRAQESFTTFSARLGR